MSAWPRGWTTLFPSRKTLCCLFSILSTFEKVCLPFYQILSVQVFFEELRISSDVVVQEHPFLNSKTVPFTKQASWWTMKLQTLVWSAGYLENKELSTILSKHAKVGYFPKEPEKHRVSCDLSDRELDCGDDQVCQKCKILWLTNQLKKSEFAQLTHSDNRLHFTWRSIRHKFLVPDNAVLEVVKCV